MTDDYLSIYLLLNKFEHEGFHYMALMFLTVARLFPIIMLSSFLGGKVLPHPVKAALGFSLFAILLPKLLVVTQSPIGFNIKFLFLFFKEMFIGYCIGFMMMVPFYAIEGAGMLTDHQRGGASLQINDPLVQSQSSPLGTLYNLIAVYLFFLVDGPFYFLEGVFDSFDFIPPDQFLTKTFFNPEVPFWKAALEMFNTIMVASIRLASPALLVILMTDMFLGIINRMAPQVMITFLGMPLKSLLGLAVVWIGWKLLTKQFVVDANAWVYTLRELLPSFRAGI